MVKYIYIYIYIYYVIRYERGVNGLMREIIAYRFFVIPTSAKKLVLF